MFGSRPATADAGAGNSHAVLVVPSGTPKRKTKKSGTGKARSQRIATFQSVTATASTGVKNQKARSISPATRSFDPVNFLVKGGTRAAEVDQRQQLIKVGMQVMHTT
jgi:hypothetical protein